MESGYDQRRGKNETRHDLTPRPPIPRVNQTTQPAPAFSRANFDGIAGVYDSLAALVFGDTLHTVQSELLTELPPDSDIAILGGGSGRILLSLKATGIPFRSIHFVDASAKMIELAKRQLAPKDSSSFPSTVHFHKCLAEDWCEHFPHALDAMITPFFLDCFEGEHLQSVIDRIAAKIRPSGQWIATDFVDSNRRHHRLLLAAMYKFFRLTCRLPAAQLQPYFRLIEKAGFRPLTQFDSTTPAGPVRSQRFSSV
jgi:tRNA (cmo5U34)-methyltransferase